jgi:hypothetical protein
MAPIICDIIIIIIIIIISAYKTLIAHLYVHMYSVAWVRERTVPTECRPLVSLSVPTSCG